MVVVFVVGCSCKLASPMPNNSCTAGVCLTSTHCCTAARHSRMCHAKQWTVCVRKSKSKKLEYGILLAGLCRPGDACNAAEGKAKQQVKHAVIQDVVACIGIKIKGLESVNAQGVHGRSERCVHAGEQIQEQARHRRPGPQRTVQGLQWKRSWKCEWQTSWKNELACVSP